MPKVIVSPRARRQLNVASRWWLSNRSKAPHAFTEDVENAFDLIRTQPFVGQPVRGKRGVRRVFLQRIRYYLFYRVVEDAIEVLALWHAARGPRPRF